MTVWLYLLTVSSLVKLFNISCNYTSIIFDGVPPANLHFWRRGRGKWIIPVEKRNCEMLGVRKYSRLGAYPRPRVLIIHFITTGRPDPPVHKCNAPVLQNLRAVSGQADRVLQRWIVWSRAALSVAQNWRVTGADRLIRSASSDEKLKRPYSDVLA